MGKTTVFNLIIIDESGSMQGLEKSTIDGCNETINTIRAQQHTHIDTQRYLVSIYAFQSGIPAFPSRYLIQNRPVEEVHNLTPDEYHPWGGTPLLDAVGSTLTELKFAASSHEDAVGVVTIITDGYENSSREYNYDRVAKLIAEVKEMGWLVNFIGANIDVERMSKTLNINNAMRYESTADGTKAMYARTSDCYANWDNSRCEEEKFCEDEDQRRKVRRSINKNFFN